MDMIAQSRFLGKWGRLLFLTAEAAGLKFYEKRNLDPHHDQKRALPSTSISFANRYDHPLHCHGKSWHI